MRYVVALGSNLGNRGSKLEFAISEIGSFATVVAVSKFLETDPVGGPEQPQYLNAVAIIESELEPIKFLEKLNEIENAAGRTREVRWGARTLDLDIITAEDVVQDDPILTLPHPRAHERGFVLQPWLEIDADATIPGMGRVDEIFAALPAQE